MKTHLLALIILISFNVFSQKKKKVYLSEKFEIITKRYYNKMFNSKLYHSISYDLDTIVYKKLRLNYFFGQLDKDNRGQLFKLLYSRNKIDTTKTLMFHYKDTLKSKKQFPKKDKTVYLKNGKHKHLVSYETFLRHHSNCKSKYDNYHDVTILHFFSVNNGHPKRVGDLIWYKDPSNVIKRVFRDGYKSFSVFVVKPDGRFFIRSLNSISAPNSEQLLNGSWDKLEAKFYKRYNKLNKKL